jgi:TRAP-type mannitol/chloroaromatic compound transport system permease small subunit
LNLFLKIASGLNKATGLLCMMLFVTMAFSVVGNIVLRYALASGSLWLQDLALFSFGLLAIFSIPVAFGADRHVRVDIVRQRQGISSRQRTDIIGILGFSIPIFILLLTYVWNDVVYSVLILESSPQIGGLPFFFLVKAGLPLACILMMVQGLAIICEMKKTSRKPI